MTDTVTPEHDAAGRTGRRTRTRQAILAAAGDLFAEHGFEQTTVRAVAHRAGVDPALVMQHFGSKERLFDAVAQIRISYGGALAGPPGELGRRLLAHVLDDVDNRPGGNLPALRSMLTHPQAAEAVRCAVADPGNSPVADALTGDDVELRAALVGTIVLGLLVSRHLLRIPEVEHAGAARVVELLGPCLQPLLEPAAEDPAGRAAEPAAGRAAEPAAGRAAEPLAELAAAEAERAAAAARVDALARAALRAGHSFSDVGRTLGITRQAARKRWQ